ncbi:FliC/FljB family flagellin [Pantoea septica]|uniref:FliC/FljB family flagellin n=1 Tax=Pantoea septica TaxID=472695 RepID=UPI001C1170B8|nr:FliC/FljB family flagellin [Pantoea septica]MBU5376412.1 FliC/FljB family flagellin [Pantoea septica]MDU5838742.1 FliC/FljB family flagellin [Pantoea sp.]
MAQVINTNSLSLITQNNINKNQSALSTSIERLSSGLRINSAKDDAAGQAIANRFTSNIKGLTQAARNANDGISAAQTTEGALSEINNNLQRIRELTVQAQNGTNSDSDKSSIQDEIKSRLDEIDRVSGQTQFNGVNVLAKDGSMKIQVGANDGQTISIDLKKIDSSTLGLNGFNVNGSGTIANKAATISDLSAAGATVTGAGPYAVTTNNASLTASDALSRLKTGDTVVTTGTSGATYTYNADKGNFTTTATVTDANTTTFANTLKPAAGTTASGTYTRSTGSVDFDVDANGAVTIGGQAAYLTTEGNLTTNNAGAGTTAATLASMFQSGSDVASAGSIKLSGTTYNFAGTADSGLTYTKTVSKDAVLSDVNAAATANAAVTGATINYNSGVQTFAATFGGANTNGAGNALNTYVDGDKELTTTAAYTVNYNVDKDTGKVTVASNGAGATGKYAAEVGAQAYVNASGKLTTETTSAGTATADPLAALDSAISSIDKFRSSLGAIQNRLNSAVTNLNNTTTNLSSAQSRIQDADYATEVSNMSKAQIIQQAGNSVLAKANQVPQQVLSLLQG